MNLTNQFLIAMPSLVDPNFAGTVTYLCAHTGEGAMGIVINRPLDLNLSDVLGHMEIDNKNPRIKNMHVMHGGPVQQERGFVLHAPAGAWDSVLKVSDEIGIATSRDILAAVAEGRGPEHTLVALGYAGWDAGQLEQEVLDNAWLSGPSDSSIIFDIPFDQRWDRAARLLGVDPERLTGEAGHA